MNVPDARKKIAFIQERLLKLQELTKIDPEVFRKDENGMSSLEIDDEMSESSPEQSLKVQEVWKDIQRSVPPGFSIYSNLIRHLSFNQANDWVNVSGYDVPRELTKVEEYLKTLNLVEYLDTLHPEISRVTETILAGDIDAALKTVFASLDGKVRQFLKINHGESTVPSIGKAFKDGVLSAPHPEDNDHARNFLQGVIGYYRSNILHNPLPLSRNRLEASLSLFALAHEAFGLFDICSKKVAD